MYLTWFDNNSWLWEIAGHRILVDPWLVGSLVFDNLGWLFKGQKRSAQSIPPQIDLILLSQGLADHAHPTTLQALDHDIPVVASANGAQVAREIGFTEVTALTPGETVSRFGITLKAVPGAPIGPTLIENGYVLTEAETGLKLFYEPHGYHRPALQAEAPVDVVLTPMMNLSLPLVGPIIRGLYSAQELADWLQPQVMVPTTDARDTDYEGLLVGFLRATGGVDRVRQQLAQAGHTVQVIAPEVGDRIELPLTPRSVTA